MGIKHNDVLQCFETSNKIIIQKSTQSKMHVINNPNNDVLNETYSLSSHFEK